MCPSQIFVQFLSFRCKQRRNHGKERDLGGDNDNGSYDSRRTDAVNGKQECDSQKRKHDKRGQEHSDNGGGALFYCLRFVYEIETRKTQVCKKSEHGNDKRQNNGADNERNPRHGIKSESENKNERTDERT